MEVTSSRKSWPWRQWTLNSGIMTVGYLGAALNVVIEDDMIVMNRDEILAAFYASLEDLAA